MRLAFRQTHLYRFVNMVEVTGFEPATSASRTQRSTKLSHTSEYGANKGTRTLDLQFTKLLLYQLSYIGTQQCIGCL